MKKYFFLRNAYFLLLFSILVTTISLSGCQKGEDGEPGPKGANGPQGMQGLQGPKGVLGELPVKGGIISGTITGFLSDNTPVNEPFQCEFFNTSAPSAFVSQSNAYFFNFGRFDSLSTQFMYISLRISSDFSSSYFSAGNFNLTKQLANGQVMRLTASQFNFGVYTISSVPEGTFSNLKYDTASGILTGNFTWNVDNVTMKQHEYYVSETSSKKNFTIKGSFSIPFKQRVFRIAASE